MAPATINSADEFHNLRGYSGSKDTKSSKVCESYQSCSQLTYSPVELQKLYEDRYELQQIIHVATRGSVKDIIQSEINLITAKISSLHDLSSGP